MTRHRLAGIVPFCVSLCLAAAAGADDRVTELIPVEPGSTPQDVCDGYPPYYGCQLDYVAGEVAFSADGSKMFFTTARQLTADDTDTDSDLFVKSNGVIRLISVGAGAGSFVASTDDGSTVYWNTITALSPQDTDALSDIYREVNGGPPELVSTGPADNGNVAAYGGRLNDDGSRFFFDTGGVLTADDADSRYDTYEVSGGVTRLVTGNGVCPGAPSSCQSLVFDVSADGTTVVFWTTEKWAGDVDSEYDYYLTSLVGGTWSAPELASSNPEQNTSQHLRGGRLTADGKRLYFISFDPLVPGARSGDYTGYVHTASGIDYAFPGPQGCPPDCFAGLEFGLSRDGTHLYFTTTTSLVPGDTDSSYDLYQRVGNTTTLLTPGPSTGCSFSSCYVSFEASSDDGSRVIFSTNEQLAPTDHDGVYDLYERFNGTTTDLTPDAASPGSFYATAPEFIGASPDAKRIVFTTGDRHSPEDTDPPNGCFWDDGDADYAYVDCFDVYAREGGVFTLLSKGPSGTNSAREAYRGWVSMSRDAQHVSFMTRETLTPADTDGGYDDFYLSAPAATSLSYVRPRGASPTYVSLVPAFQQCVAPNATHGAPLAFGSCGPPAQASPNLTVGTPDANGSGAKSVGWATLSAHSGNPSTPADEADVRFDLSMSDVRTRPGLGDYTGALRAQASVRRTDKDTGVPATMVDFPFSFTVPCSATADATVGASCAVTTSADSVVPGAVVESARTIWALHRVEVYDGNGELFATQGLFVP